MRLFLGVLALALLLFAGTQPNEAPPPQTTTCTAPC